MDIREVSEQEKMQYIANVQNIFKRLRDMLNTLEIDMVSDDLMIQASAVWISGNLCTWYDDFMAQIRAIDQQQKTLKDIQGDLENVVQNNPPQVNMVS